MGLPARGRPGPNPLETELRRLERYRLLVVDEVGYLPLERQAANLLFALVSRRYERGSIIVTSNRGFEQWGEIFGDAMVAAALIDASSTTRPWSASRARATACASADSASRPPLKLRRSAPPPERQHPPEASLPLDRPAFAGERKFEATGAP